MRQKTILVTGGAGFIGCNLVRYLLENTEDRIVVLDKLTYAGSLLNLAEVEADPRYAFVQADIADPAAVAKVFLEYEPAAVMNLAAETHVDRSIEGPRAFIETNVVGVFNLLETARQYLAESDEALKKSFRFLQVSTDEVYGTLGSEGLFSETTPYAPNSPYSASKAGADHLVRAYFHTYGFPAFITNCSNNYGPYQFPEKLIPLMILNALEGKPLPVYGTGANVRDWLHVRDHCAGLYAALTKGVPGEKYNIGGNNELTNLEIIHRICSELEKLRPSAGNPSIIENRLKDYSGLITYVKDRPGHDLRYAIDASKAKKELGWSPAYTLDNGLAETVRWYVEHLEWCEQIQKGKYQRQRLGQINKP